MQIDGWEIGQIPFGVIFEVVILHPIDIFLYISDVCLFR